MRLLRAWIPAGRSCRIGASGFFEERSPVIQRKVLDPNDVADLDELQQRLLAFQRLYQQAAKPFEWKFTRQDLANYSKN